MAFDAEVWLSVVETAPDERDVQAFWNVKDNVVLGAVTGENRLWLGDTRVGESRSPGAAGRIFDMLFLLGTTPTYRLPMITDELLDQVLEAYDEGTADGLPVASRSDLAQWLQQRRGKFLAPS
jgi:hypothetical protein